MLVIIMPRTIQLAPIYMNPLHFETNLSLDCIEKTIQRTLDAYKIHYTYPDETSIFKFNTSVLTGEIRIFKDINDVEYVVEFVRYKGDGFLMNELYAKIYETLVVTKLVK
jgi:hypothetical protein